MSDPELPDERVSWALHADGLRLARAVAFMTAIYADIDASDELYPGRPTAEINLDIVFGLADAVSELLLMVPGGRQAALAQLGLLAAQRAANAAED